MTVQATSLEAYRSVNTRAVDRAVLAHLAGRPDTCDSIEVTLGMRHQTASSAIRRLTIDGVVQWTGERRPTRSGRRALVWGVA